jgi:hypothetical protein
LTKEKQEKGKRLVAQYKQVFSTPEGKAVLFDLMKGNYIVASDPHVPGDPYATHVNIGQANVVKKILHIIKMDPEKFFQLVEEQESQHV